MDQKLQYSAFEHTRSNLRDPFSASDFTSNGSWVSMSRTEWLRHVRTRLKALTDLPVAWDGYGAQKIPTETALFTLQILMDIWTARLPAPELSAMSNGSIMAEFQRNDFELTIEIAGPYSSTFIFERPNGEELSGDIAADVSQVRTLAAEMMAADPVVGLVA